MEKLTLEYYRKIFREIIQDEEKRRGIKITIREIEKMRESMVTTAKKFPIIPYTIINSAYEDIIEERRLK